MSEDTMDNHEMHHADHGVEHKGAHQDHLAHRAAITAKYSSKQYARSEASYDVESIDLLRMDEKLVQLADEIKGDGPVLLNFIFTSCTTICPVLTSTFSDFQKKLGEEAKHVTMVSISIDPQYDTAAKLREYAERFGAGPQWKFYTGSDEQSIIAQKAFDAYRGGKMNHIPLTFLKSPTNNKWIRIEGFTSSSQLLDEYHNLTNS
jgi:protein SCO1/2